MSNTFIAKVAVENIVFHLDKLYDYLIPIDLHKDINIGCRVLIPFGSGNKIRQGIILQKAFSSNVKNLKNIFAIIDKYPILNDEMLELIKFIKQKYFCTIFDAFKLIIPSGMNFKLSEQFKICDNFDEKFLLDCNETEKKLIIYLKNFSKWISKKELLNKFGPNVLNTLKKLEKNFIIKKKDIQNKVVYDAKIKMVRLTKIFDDDIDCINLTAKQKTIYDILNKRNKGISLKELLYLSGMSIAVVDNLVKKNIAEYFEEKIFRDPYKNLNINKVNNKIILNDEQNIAYNSILKLYKEKKYNVSLLYGVTGSGKTSVFMKLIDNVINDGKNVIVMVPEIALTPQMVRIFKSKFWNKVAVFHSGLSFGERMDEYTRVKLGLVNIVIGTRSAIFAPFEKIGLIIIDEEQESSYKSEATPRFNAKEIAKFRCAYHNCLLLLASATPSIENFFYAKNNKYSLNILKNRYFKTKLPDVSIVDMNKEIEMGNFSPFSSELINKLTENLVHKKQSILLLNRRGYNTLVSCRSCSRVLMCPNCSIALTFHSANKKLMCHYCGFSINNNECLYCHDNQLKYIGTGTQKIENDLKKFLPSARILRMDTDTMVTKFSYETKLRDFADEKYDIMLGTQMVAKGLDFFNVTLVGVLSADQSLYNSDFRGFERTFSLLTQVIGRSGRKISSGCAIIQTFNPENSIIKLSAAQDYDSFFEDEIKLRKALLYPPFTKLCVIGFVGTKEKHLINTANLFFKIMKDLIKLKYSDLAVKILGPSPAQVFKVSGKFRYKIIIKFKNEAVFRNFLKDSLFKFGECKKTSGISIFVDIDPQSIL